MSLEKLTGAAEVRTPHANRRQKSSRRHRMGNASPQLETITRVKHVVLGSPYKYPPHPAAPLLLRSMADSEDARIALFQSISNGSVGTYCGKAADKSTEPPFVQTRQYAGQSPCGNVIR